MRGPLTAAALLAALLAFPPLGGPRAAGADGVRVLELRHRPAEALLPVARELLGDEGRAAADGRRLLLRGPPGLLEGVLPALQALDRPPRPLRLLLRSGRGSPPLGAGGLRRWSTQGAGERRRELRLTEGRPVALSVGRLLPAYRLAALGGAGPAAAWLAELAHLPATAAVEVRAWLLEGEVLLELRAAGRRAAQAGAQGPLATHGLATQLRLPLDRWVLLGAQGGGGLQEDQAARRLGTGEGDRGWWLAARVEPLPAP